MCVEITSTSELETKTFSGSDQFLKKPLTGPWDQKDFLIVPRMTFVDLGHLGIG
jgi:hypothetical protein